MWSWSWLDWLGDVPTAIWAGLFGAAVAQVLTWVRERRRNRDQYRAPQRDAIAALMVAHNELKIAIADFQDAMKPSMPATEANRALNAFIRGLMDTDRAFSVCRLVVGEPACRAKLDEARGKYDRLAAILAEPGYRAAIGRGGAAFAAFVGEVSNRSDELDTDRIELVKIAERRLGVQPPLPSRIRHWFAKRGKQS